MKLRKYLSEASKLGFKVLDVYRYKDKEVLRVLYKDKVMVIEISKLRENMSLEDFRRELQSKLPT